MVLPNLPPPPLCEPCPHTLHVHTYIPKGGLFLSLDTVPSCCPYIVLPAAEQDWFCCYYRLPADLLRVNRCRSPNHLRSCLSMHSRSWERFGSPVELRCGSFAVPHAVSNAY